MLDNDHLKGEPDAEIPPEPVENPPSEPPPEQPQPRDAWWGDDEPA